MELASPELPGSVSNRLRQIGRRVRRFLQERDIGCTQPCHWQQLVPRLPLPCDVPVHDPDHVDVNGEPLQVSYTKPTK